MSVLKVKNNGVWEEVGGVSGHTHTTGDITDFPSSLPANGGNADTVDGKHASDFASATDVSDLQSKVGDISVATQITNAIDPINTSLDGKLDKSGGTMTGNISMGGKNIAGAGSVDSTHYFIGDSSDISEYSTNFNGTYGINPLCVSTDQGGYNLIVGGGKIGGLTGTPSNNDDAANKKYVDDVAAGKLNANQGTANAGKYLGIGSDGAVAPVAAPAGGGSGESDWRLIKDITVEADVKSVSVSSDYNGAGFSCREIYILSNAVNKSDQTSATYLKLAFNGQSKYDGNTNQYPYATFGKTGESGRNWFWVKSINPLILFHGKWVTTNSTQGNNVQCIQPHINDAAPNPFSEGEKIESIEISGGLSSSYIASGSRILIYGR